MSAALTILCIVLAVMFFAEVSYGMRKRRVRKATEELLPQVADHIRRDRRYNLFLSHGEMIKNATFIGISKTIKGIYPPLPFPLRDWLIIEKPTGERVYIKPESVRYYEDHGVSQ